MRKNDDTQEEVHPLRTIIAYMAADNNLWDVVYIDLEEIKQGYRETGVNLIVLMDVADKTPCLLRIIEDGEQMIKNTVYPYLLRGMEISRCNQVWEMDITYISMGNGFMYLSAIIDVNSRYVLNWNISNTMEAVWCKDIVAQAIAQHGTPEIFNTDQGSQFTSEIFTSYLLDNKIKISMDGRGRATDNIYIERLWRSVKQEKIYLNAYETGNELYRGLKTYFEFYNKKRPHQSLDYICPISVYEKIKKSL
jgi:putative transposase